MIYCLVTNIIYFQAYLRLSSKNAIKKIILLEQIGSGRKLISIGVINHIEIGLKEKTLISEVIDLP